ncbi:WG repeat-containing protein [Cellulophaga sp. 20_2_10]|uniref:WG repeat-containing protein n=1 Tax=Cellulophaga sp. 20_2_10 TaxID=2942476 RepID=UPI00201A7F9A|nr:WG repeat-containing protein [Cellulophaga sp. 20_2_10]MCL5246621.1 WG repeat-containing protein [Cellulophaga sp. 20_2_10]
MKNIIYLITVLLTVVSCTKNQSKDNTELNEFISALDNKPLEEIKEEVNTNIKQFESMAKFFNGSFSNDIKTIDKEDEKYEEPFKVDTTGIGKALNQFKNVKFSQTYSYYKSDLQFIGTNNDNEGPIKLGQGVTQTFIPEKIYYHDGEVRTDSIEDYELDFHFNEDWGKAKAIDSVDITFKVDYVKDYDVVEISSDNPTVQYKGGEINFVKAEGNYIYFTLSDTIASPVKVQGHNEEGKVLDRSGYSNNGVAPGDEEDILTEMLGYFKKLQGKLNDDDFKDTAELQEYLKDNLSSVDFFNDDDGIFHKQYYYYGTVKSVKLFFKKDSKTQETTFTAYNHQPTKKNDALIAMQTEDAIVFIDNNGEPKITIQGAGGLESIGGNFYEDYSHFYHLNKAEEKLDTLLVYSVEAFSNGLVGILPEQESDNYTLVTQDNKPIGSKLYWQVKEIDNLVFGITYDDKYYLLDEHANATLLPGIHKIYDTVENDRLMVSDTNSKIGFMNSKGKLVIPCKYSDAKDFEDGITTVAFNGTYKLIDTNGKVLLDTEEDDLDFLQKDDNEKRIYSFNYGRKKYNYKGELIEE